MDTESFFQVFSYHHLMHDAIDGGLTYELCVILRDITTASGLQLKARDKFETVYFVFEKAEFQFINWQARLGCSHSACNNACQYESVPDASSVTISQTELAPFLHWFDTDENYEEHKHYHKENIKDNASKSVFDQNF